MGENGLPAQINCGDFNCVRHYCDFKLKTKDFSGFIRGIEQKNFLTPFTHRMQGRREIQNRVYVLGKGKSLQKIFTELQMDANSLPHEL